MAGKVQVYVEGDLTKKVNVDAGYKEREFQIRIGGKPYNHVSAAPDGTWVYREEK